MQHQESANQQISRIQSVVITKTLRSRIRFVGARSGNYR